MGCQVCGFSDWVEALHWGAAHADRVCCAAVHLQLLRHSVAEVLSQCAQRQIPAIVLQLSATEPSDAQVRVRALSLSLCGASGRGQIYDACGINRPF